MPAMASVMELWRTCERLPAGRRIFSLLFSWKAPYFRTVRPVFLDLRPHRADLVVRKRWGVQNHIGTVHAIALCNGLEAAMGALAEVTIPCEQRWIPKAMQVNYLAKADSDIRCVAETTPDDWAVPPEGGEVPVAVSGRRRDGTVVIDGTITLWVTPRKR